MNSTMNSGHSLNILMERVSPYVHMSTAERLLRIEECEDTLRTLSFTKHKEQRHQLLKEISIHEKMLAKLGQVFSTYDGKETIGIQPSADQSSITLTVNDGSFLESQATLDHTSVRALRDYLNSLDLGG